MRIKLDLDNELTERLIQEAVRERRPVAWHAEVLLRRALGLPFPVPEPQPSFENDPAPSEPRRRQVKRGECAS